MPIHNREHKLGLCKLIMDLYPDLPFILIGDSAQEDPEVYLELVECYAGRVKAVYIRSVSHRPGRVEAIRELADKVAGEGSQLLLAEDTQPLMEHAFQHGWIRRD